MATRSRGWFSPHREVVHRAPPRPLAWFIGLLFAMTEPTVAADSQPPALVRVAASQAVINGVAVAPSGRIFSTFPRWTDEPTPGVAEVTAQGLRPFPGGAWNDWKPGLPTQDRFVSAHSVHADAHNNLWVVDDAAPFFGKPLAGGPKLVQIDLGTNRVARVYRLDEQAQPPGSYLAHVRVADGFAYLAEAKLGAIIVIDLVSGAARRVLSNHPSTRADPSIVPVVEGRELRAHGKVPQYHVDLIELSKDGQWLYYTPLFGPILSRVPTAALRNPALSDEDLGKLTQSVTRVPPLSGITRDQHGNFYLCSFTQDAILKMGPDNEPRILVSHPRISLPNQPSVGPDGYLYFAASQVHRTAMFNEGVSRVQLPFELLKVRLPDPRAAGSESLGGRQ